MFAQVAVDVPLFTTLTYEVPEHLAPRLRPGQLVQVPFRNRAKTGLLMRLHDELEDEELEDKVRALLDVVDPDPLLSESGLEFLQFISEYYVSPIGEVVRLAIPAAVRVEGIKHYQRVETIDMERVPARLRLIVASMGEEPVAVRELKEAFDLLYVDLAELEACGAVSVSYADDVKVRAKTEKFYVLVREPDKRVGSKQAEIINYLRSQPEPVPLSELRERFNSPYSSLSSLEERGVVRASEEEVYRDPFVIAEIKPPKDIDLTEAQSHALSQIAAAREEGVFRAFALHGVTGSGKTEVYVRAIRATIRAGKRALVLLPEIALTPQFVSVFRGYFGDDIAVLHSGLTTAEKFDQWRRIRRNEVDIVIGARSAIFAPINDLGIIVVDEEHDPSFKQEEGPRYNARDMALLRAKLEGAQVVLGSATPSLETFQNAREGRIEYLGMPDRVGGRPLPTVEIVDLRTQSAQSGQADVFSPRLLEAVEQALSRNLQVIFFLNRRGFSPCVICEACGHVWKCSNCDVSLTYHRRQEALRCHHCDYSIRLPETCPHCANHGVGPRGIGTEQLEGHLQGLFPRSRIARLDRDTTRGKGLQKLIRSFSQGEIDLLVGTQMVTKGHDFPGVTCVGVVLADLGLNFPDFRGAERTFQLLTQVAGRAGRGDNPGHVFIQTYSPEHYSLIASSRHDFALFAEQELARRQVQGLPPFGHLIALKFEASRENAVAAAARDYATAARRRARHDKLDDVLIKGPALAPFERLRGKTRWQMLFQSRSRARLRQLVLGVLNDLRYFDVADRPHKNVRVVVDVDPINLL